MKVVAFILLLSFTAFSSEAVILPLRSIKVAQTTVHYSCSKCKMMQQHKSCGKETSKNDCKQCTNCPVFSIFYPDHVNVSSLVQPLFQFNYTIFSDRFISNYATDTWKPPNTI